MLFGAARTIPFFSEYGILALRDAVLWGYGLFSIAVAGMILSRPARLTVLVGRYRRFVPVFLVAAPVLWLTTLVLDNLPRWFGVTMPTWPGTEVPLILVKASDMLVHLSGVAAFMCLGFAGESRTWRNVLLIIGVALSGMNRGGLLAFSLAFAVILAVRPRSRGSWQVVTTVLVTIALLGVTGLRLRFPGSDREVSFEQLIVHAHSLTGASTVAPSATAGAAQDLENTKEWRLAWWAVIASYTIGGEYRWGGKGYGVNLANDDGFQTSDDDSLRSPHNVNMTVLARSGVIGLALWLLLQGTWVIRIWRALRDARRRGHTQWHALFGFLLAYWLALLVTGTFDVFLEGPAGGIWFWTVFGVGIAAEMVYRSGETAAPSWLPAVPE
jgi:hypothetical protein